MYAEERERNTVDSQKFLRTKLTVFGFITSDITLSCSINDMSDIVDTSNSSEAIQSLNHS